MDGEDRGVAVEVATGGGAGTLVAARTVGLLGSVVFRAPSGNGSAISRYTATSTPGGLTGVCTASPCTVTGLTDGIAYTFAVVATNGIGDSVTSGPSVAVTPHGGYGVPAGRPRRFFATEPAGGGGWAPGRQSAG